jgi:alkylation response protein AidB-like acyl-CoA dehydrogenase
VVDVPADRLTVREVRGLDPRMGLVELRTPAEGIPVDAGTGAPVSWERALAAGRTAVAHQLVGAATAMLELARGHALERVQFGRPIASFQAVRHRLADSLLATETARSALTAAWDDQTRLTAGIAKAVAGRSARTVARHAQQVLAGMGFTAEHPFHLYLRRTLVLDELLGSSRELTRALGVELLRTRRLPELLPL